MGNGVGAWKAPRYYGLGMNLPPDGDKYGTQRVRWAVIAIQEELIRQGFLARPPYALDGQVGPKTDTAIKAFQKASGLVPDGQVGPKTSGRLFFLFFAWWEITLGIPDHLLTGLVRLESAFDPGAEGSVDDRDRGICQFNRDYHPDITDEVAFSDPPFCIARTADMLVRAHAALGDWNAAVANHNNPKKAKQWASSGEAPDDQIAKYVKLVRAAGLAPL